MIRGGKDYFYIENKTMQVSAVPWKKSFDLTCFVVIYMNIICPEVFVYLEKDKNLTYHVLQIVIIILNKHYNVKTSYPQPSLL